jgi:pimeloyl-ACP methyl ester carboxylesterase
VAVLEPARSHYVRCCGFDLHVREWGRPGAPAIVAWHGLARNAADFDPIGSGLAQQFRVVAPDTIGRGLSQWSHNPGEQYALPFYLQLAAALLDELGIEHAGWIGTSMGGIVGLAAAATLLRDRIGALLLNDVTPAAPDLAGLQRIAGYVGNPPAFETMREFEAYLRAVYAPAGPRTDDAWRATAETSMRRLPDGRITAHYDPAIALAFANLERTSDLWKAYETLHIPVMLVRGERSDIAGSSAAERMAHTGPRARVHELPGIGHAPWLETPDEIELALKFFRETLL